MLWPWSENSGAAETTAVVVVPFFFSACLVCLCLVRAEEFLTRQPELGDTTLSRLAAIVARHRHLFFIHPFALGG